MAVVSPGYRSQTLVDTTVRVLTWNLWWRFGADWERRQEGLVAVLREQDADLMCLQEVWQDGEDCQAARLAQALGVEYAYTGASRIGEVWFGNALMSRWPIRHSESRMLPSMPSDDGGRNCRVLMAEIEGPRGPLDVYTTHLSYKPEESAIRQRQVKAICQMVAERPSRPFPAIVAGDFNAVPESDEIRMMTGKAAVPVDGLVFYDAWEAANAEGPGFTWSHENAHTALALEPDRRLDYVFAGKPLANGAGHIRRAWRFGREPVDGLLPSDHYGVAAEIRY